MEASAGSDQNTQYKHHQELFAYKNFDQSNQEDTGADHQRHAKTVLWKL